MPPEGYEARFEECRQCVADELAAAETRKAAADVVAAAEAICRTAAGGVA